MKYYFSVSLGLNLNSFSRRNVINQSVRQTKQLCWACMNYILRSDWEMWYANLVRKNAKLFQVPEYNLNGLDINRMDVNKYLWREALNRKMCSELRMWQLKIEKLSTQDVASLPNTWPAATASRLSDDFENFSSMIFSRIFLSITSAAYSAGRILFTELTYERSNEWSVTKEIAQHQSNRWLS